ncbi:hypothetical protein FALBO_13024 [Fusarium albosuccineum]|uniref:Uncharacterized protein n=1 Tax=Fusarium albosuccineum TaxID=1237068 RepID=A0A8H4P2L1_9HYPO|nr:hypothetical protein FALBO_13024 [Fusarium albosuccineum]
MSGSRTAKWRGPGPKMQQSKGADPILFSVTSDPFPLASHRREAPSESVLVSLSRVASLCRVAEMDGLALARREPASPHLHTILSTFLARDREEQ